MANLGTVTKQVAEVQEYTRDFTTELSSTSAVSISSATVSVSPVGLTVTASISSTEIIVKYSGGTNETNYKVTLLSTTDNGLIYEDELYVTVQNV